MKEHKSTNEYLGFLNTSNSDQIIHAIQHLEKKVSGEKTGLQKNDSNDNSLGWDGSHEILWSNSPHKVRLTWTLYHTGPCPKSTLTTQDQDHSTISEQPVAMQPSPSHLPKFSLKKLVCPFAVHLQEKYQWCLFINLRGTLSSV